MPLLDRIRSAVRGERREDPGERTGRWSHPDAAHGDADDRRSVDVDGDPRGGSQPRTYRKADPPALAVSGDVATTGPAGAPVGEMGDGAPHGRRRGDRPDVDR